MSTVDYTTFRGDTITFAAWCPGADLSDAVIKATLKRKLDDRHDDSLAVWKKDFDGNDPQYVDDPTSGVIYIPITGDPDDADGSTYDLEPNKTYTLDVEFNLAGFPDGQGRRSVQSVIKVRRDGTRREP